MRHHVSRIGLAGAVATLVVGCAGDKSPQDPPPKDAIAPREKSVEPETMSNDVRARRFVNLLAGDQFAEAAGGFDRTMKQALPPDKLQQTWRSLVAQVGAFQGVADTRSETKDAHEVVFVTCKFEKTALDAKIVFDGDHRIAGLFFVPSQAAAAEVASSWTPPPYARKESFEEEEITIGAGEWQLPATLTLPVGAGSFPAVVLVHGSGPHDRDETIGPNKPFRDLAWGLASRGVSVVRPSLPASRS